jgi:N-acetylglutamate synthase
VDHGTQAWRQHENILGWLGACSSQVPSAVTWQRDGVALFATGLPFTLFNRVFVAGESASPIAFADAIATLRERGAPFSVDLRRGVDDALIPVILANGLVRDPDEAPMPGMALAPIPTSVPAPADLVIERAVDEAGLERHIQALFNGYGIPDTFARPIMTSAMLANESLAIYTGLLESAPVVSGFGVRTGTTIGIYNIATVPAARRRGFGEAMTARIAADGAANGCDLAILQASTMGFPIYSRMGYRTVVEYDSYAEPGTPVFD